MVFLLSNFYAWIQRMDANCPSGQPLKSECLNTKGLISHPLSGAGYSTYLPGLLQWVTNDLRLLSARVHGIHGSQDHWDRRRKKKNHKGSYCFITPDMVLFNDTDFSMANTSWFQIPVKPQRRLGDKEEIVYLLSSDCLWNKLPQSESSFAFGQSWETLGTFSRVHASNIPFWFWQ